MKTLFQIYQAIEILVCERISKAEEACEILNATHSGQDQVKNVHLKSFWTEFEKLLIKDNEKIQNIFRKVSSIIN